MASQDPAGCFGKKNPKLADLPDHSLVIEVLAISVKGVFGKKAQAVYDRCLSHILRLEFPGAGHVSPGLVSDGKALTDPGLTLSSGRDKDRVPPGSSPDGFLPPGQHAAG